MRSLAPQYSTRLGDPGEWEFKYVNLGFIKFFSDMCSEAGAGYAYGSPVSMVTVYDCRDSAQRMVKV